MEKNIFVYVDGLLKHKFTNYDNARDLADKLMRQRHQVWVTRKPIAGV